jgi:uncharacterized protein (TIGR02569 family)
VTAPPPPSACRAFGVTDEPVLLPGGFSQTAWRAGGVVLKRVAHQDEHAWVCDVYDGWVEPDVRVPRPLRAETGSWSHDGWGAHVWLEGEPCGPSRDPDRFRSAAQSFHGATASLEPPGFIATRDDAWSYGDRVAWEGAVPVGTTGTLAQLARGLTLLAPVDLPCQVVHGDLAGNVLFAPRLPPAVIDWPPYVRPAGWALAVAAMDAVCFGGADPALLDRWADQPQWDQLLVRALVYRIATRGRREMDAEEPFGSDGYVEEGRGLRLLEERLR